jgi:hypothetical protein
MKKVTVIYEDIGRKKPQKSDLKKAYSTWIPLEYQLDQLHIDVMRYWQLDSTKYELCDMKGNILLHGEKKVESALDIRRQLILRKRLTKTMISPEKCALLNNTNAFGFIGENNTFTFLTNNNNTEEDSNENQSPDQFEKDSNKKDPFWIQEKLFDLFLSYALQNMNGKVLWITGYQFKNLLQKATADTIFQKKKKKN